MYGREHGVPHIHLEGPDFRCSMSISSGEVIIGTAPAQAVKAVRAWVRENQAMLLAKWRELNA
jgi:hypothetical protein